MRIPREELPAGSYALRTLQTAIEHQEQGQITLQFLRDKKILFHVLVTMFSELCGNLRMGQQESDLIGGAFHRMRQKARVLVNDLCGNATHRRSDNRLLFPERF